MNNLPLYPPSKVIRFLSNMRSTSSVETSEENLAGFLTAQKLAYRCVQEVAAEVKVGMTEYEIAGMLTDWLHKHDAHLFLHTPFCWIGHHARFDPYNENYQEYLPSKTTTLKEDDIFILDVSPVVNGYIGDVGYTTSLKPKPELDEAMDFLLQLRDEIPKLFSTSDTVETIWAKIDQIILDAGYDNCHAKYPFRVLGHRVYRVPKILERIKLPRLPVGILGGSWFSPQGLLEFLSHGFFNELLTPSHVGDKKGIWAIEPHIGANGFGAKFEEILIVEDGHAYWLDDEVPHVLRVKK